MFKKAVLVLSCGFMIFAMGCQKSEVAVSTENNEIEVEQEENIRSETSIQIANQVEGLDTYVELNDLVGEEQTGYTTVDLASETEFQFSGVLIKDLANRYASEETKQVVVTARDGYAVLIKREVWEQTDVLLATSKNDIVLNLEEDGPAKIVFPQDASDVVGWDNCHEGQWIYQINKIEFK